MTGDDGTGPEGDAARGSDDAEHGGPDDAERRALLKALGSAGAVALAGGAYLLGQRDSTTDPPVEGGGPTPPSTTPTAADAGTPPPDVPPALAQRFDRTVDVVDDLDCDPSGSTPCDGAIREAAADGTLLTFPEGTYRMADRVRLLDVGRIGLFGTGEARFRPPTGFNESLFTMFGADVVVRNVDFDLGAENTTTGLNLVATDRLVVDGVTFHGRGTHRDGEVVNAISAAVTDPEKYGLVRNVVATEGSAIGHYKAGKGRIGIWVGGWHQGTMRIRDCHLEEFGNNGIYASNCPGKVQVSGGTYRNNNAASVRVGGRGSFVEDATIEVDLSGYRGPMTSTQRSYNTRGIVIEQKANAKPPGGTIRNCDVRIENAAVSQGGIVVWSSASGVRVRNSRVRVAVDEVPAIGMLAPGETSPATTRPQLEIRDTTVEGEANGRTAIEVFDRSNVVVAGTTITGTGSGRDGLRFVRSSNCSLTDSTVSVPNYPVVFRSAEDHVSGPCFVSVDPSTTLESGELGVSEGRANYVSVDEDCLPVDPFSAAIDQGLLQVGFLALEDGRLYWQVLPESRRPPVQDPDAGRRPATGRRP